MLGSCHQTGICEEPCDISDHAFAFVRLRSDACTRLGLPVRHESRRLDLCIDLNPRLRLTDSAALLKLSPSQLQVICGCAKPFSIGRGLQVPQIFTLLKHHGRHFEDVEMGT